MKIPIAKTKPRVIPLTKEALTEINNADLPFRLTKYALDKNLESYAKNIILKMHTFMIYDIRH